jgi:hypothetical protein
VIFKGGKLERMMPKLVIMMNWMSSEQSDRDKNKTKAAVGCASLLAQPTAAYFQHIEV